MSQAEFVPRPLPVFTKLVVMLRNIPAVQFVFAKFAALLRMDESFASSFLGTASNVVRKNVDQMAISKSSSDLATAKDDQTDREKLIRRRWAETGSKMWNSNNHGVGLAALNIQGRVELLPPVSGETLPRYDTLEFKLIGDRILCEGVVVGSPDVQGSSLCG